MKNLRILFLAKDKPFSKDAAELLKLHFEDARIVFGNLNEKFDSRLLELQTDYVISYISPWIVPKQVLDNAEVAAINFHPGPPEYPGIGCTNFAIYNGEKEFGITVHHMAEKVDTGNIISVERFPLFEHDTVFTLTQRCYAYIYISFVKILAAILNGSILPASNEKWKRKPYTRKELEELCKLKKSMHESEIQRRIRATTYPGMPGAVFID